MHPIAHAPPLTLSWSCRRPRSCIAAIATQALLPWKPLPGLRRRLAALWAPRRTAAGALHTHALDWARLSAPLNSARAALLLHVAAAALALGVVAGLYLRGLVLDYRAGWQSTFLTPAQVHAVLDLGLAPARALTGLSLPDVDALAALRVSAASQAQGAAAPRPVAHGRWPGVAGPGSRAPTRAG